MSDVWDRIRLWHYRAKIVRVIDGDTFVALVDTGFYGRHEAHIRIADIDAREMNEPGGADDRDALALALASAHDWPLRIVTRQRESVIIEVRSFERYVADVFVVAADGSIVNVLHLL